MMCVVCDMSVSMSVVRGAELDCLQQLAGMAGAHLGPL